MKPRFQEKIGKKVNLLTIVECWRTNGVTYSKCNCDCGGNKTSRLSHVLSGNVKSCGCAVGVNNIIHGGKGTKLYAVWSNMRNRCTNKNHKFYNRYGGRGINVCNEWQDFIVFREWAVGNGYIENTGLTIERKDNDQGYSPDNCKWATWEEQAVNKSNTVKKKINNKILTVKDIQSEYNLTYHKAHHKLNMMEKGGSSQLGAIEIQVIGDAIKAGFRVKDIARYFKKSESNISGHLRNLGIGSQRGVGSRSSHVKLDEKRVFEIKKHLRDGKLSQRKIANLFGVSDSTIGAIKCGLVWTHVEL